MHWGFLTAWVESDQGHNKEILIMTAAGCLSKGIGGNSRCVCLAVTAGPEREESHLISLFKGECLKAKAKTESGYILGR